MKYLFIVDVGVGILMVILAIPMILQRVKPNVWYGLRTAKTLADEQVWYAANRYAGKALLFAGLVMAVAAGALYLVAGSAEYGTVLSTPLLFAISLIIFVVPLAASIISSFSYLRRL